MTDTTTTETKPSAKDTKPTAETGAKTPAQAKSSAGKTAKKQAPAQGQRKRPVFTVDATTITRQVRIGNRELARTVFAAWSDIHQALYYLTDFARATLKGRVVNAANSGLSQYIVSQTEYAKAMLEKATEQAEHLGIRFGAPGVMKEQPLEISCRVESNVIELVKLLDDYIVVMDSLWMAGQLEDRKRDDAHAEGVRIIKKLRTLLNKMYQKMVEYRRAHMANKLTKSDDLYARSIEQIILDITGINIRPPTDKPAESQPAAPQTDAVVTTLPIQSTPVEQPEMAMAAA